MMRLTIARVPKIVWPLLLLAAAIAFPFVDSRPLDDQIAVLTLLYASATTGWSIFSGYTGYISLGHSTFYGFGAYTLSLIAIDHNLQGGFGLFLLVPVAGLIAALIAVPLGWIELRTRGHAFVVITLFTVFIFQLLAFNLTSITNGSIGLFLPSPGFDVSWFVLPFYFVQLAILVLALVVSWYIRSSKYGLGLLAIRDDEDRAEGLGVRTGGSKLIALVVSAFFMGMVGAMYAYFIGNIYPQDVFSPPFTINIVLMGYLGGAGTLAGPVLGALILEPAQQYFGTQFGGSGSYAIMLGALFLIVMLLMPQGIVGTLTRLWTKWRASRGAGTSPVAPEREPIAVERG